MKKGSIAIDCSSKEIIFTNDEVPPAWHDRWTNSKLIFICVFCLILTLFSLNYYLLLEGKLSCVDKGDETQVYLLSESFVVESESAFEPSIYTSQTSQHSSILCSDVDEKDRFDCNPDDPISDQVCLSRGCCWNPKNDNSSKPHLGLPPVDVPYCYYPKNYLGYKILHSKESANELFVRLERVFPSGFPNDSQIILVAVSGLDEKRLRIRIIDPDRKRYEVPLPFFNLSQSSTINSPLYSVELVRKEGDFLKITRRSTGTVIFLTDLRKLVFSDQFIQISVKVPSRHLYGIGEHYDSFQKELTWKRYTLFNQDSPPIPNTNLYGSYPFYLMVENDQERNSHGVFLLNSNAMDVILQPTPAVTWRTIGGVLDFFIFMGPSAPEVVRQNLNLVGKPAMQPYWALGFHLCKFGYGSLENTNKTLQRNLDAGIPIDVQWNDIDYMDKRNDFTYDHNNFEALPRFIDELHEKGMHYVAMMDPGVSAGEPNGTYPPYDEGVKIFIKNSTGQVFIGKVWNAKATAWPDFISQDAWYYWTKMLKDFHKTIKFDGTWIDMNEPSNFYDGQIDGCPDDPLESPPYVPGGQKLSTKTICMTAIHKYGYNLYGPHYNFHNLFGLYETFATNIALAKIRNKRPFIVSRSSFPGQGHFGSHWSGDVFSDWGGLNYSITNMLNFNIFGTPMVGSDICGFNGNTTEELCMRWSALGAFYPFSRNHNSDNTIEQDPVALGLRVVAAAKYSLKLRYTILPYLYLLMFKSHMLGDTVARPLFFEFPKDDTVYAIQNQFMWGSTFMIAPILEPGISSIPIYFPKSWWYDFSNRKLFIKSNGESKDVHIDDDKIGLFIRAGSVFQIARSVQNTVEQRKHSAHLLVAPDENGQAEGEYYEDDGESLDNIEKGNYIWVTCKLTQGILGCSPVQCNGGHKLSSVIILNVESVTNVTVNGHFLESFKHDLDSKQLEIPLSNITILCDGLKVQIS